ncbi:MAG: hypothetical protein CVU05_07945 [Bacteroidetes bacterium HGW-Bacteroidetes-21]|jgi:hypothetical protein|nr:MAG: hypothetical protein CVU05_07945 [Bacteroidetes bacterium HGW-Bacteroidetes-21]
MENNKIAAQIQAKLISGKMDDIIAAVTLVSDKAQVDSLPLLASVYTQNNDQEIKNIIRDFFNNLKYTAAVKVILEMISTEKDADTKFMLVSSAWQSGLDYSENLSLFISLLIEKDFLLAFEAFTVIESSIDFIPNEKAKILLAEDIRKKQKSMSEDMVKMTDDLINML